MADVFLSYAREDQSWARLLASALESRGWSVWWDRRIPPGKKFASYIEQQLTDARCIVVLWSKHSIVSTFVHDEASEGLNDGRLVPVLIETVRQPIGFRQYHAADLSDWREGQPHEELDRLIDSIRSVAPPSAAPRPAQPATVPQSAKPRPAQPTGAQQSAERAVDLRPRLKKTRVVSAKPKVEERRQPVEIILGLDLGATRAVASLWEGNQPVLITNNEGSWQTPAVVAFTKAGELLVGQTAKRQAVTNPENTISSIKRFLGRTFDEVAAEMKIVPYKVVRAANGDVRIEANGKTFAPPEVAAAILQSLKRAAEQSVGRPIAKAVITVPAYFNDAQRQATRDAGRIAGLDVVRIVNEPTAAALAYGLDKQADETIAVYDFGGGTFDVSILEIGGGVVEAKSTNGDTHLGGEDLDQRVVEWLVADFKKRAGLDLGKDRMALQRLKEAAEKAKIELSTMTETEINLPFITADENGPKHLQANLTRAKFEQLVDDLLQRTVGPTRQALADAGLEAAAIDQVLLVGGTSRIPKVQALVKELFGKEPMSGVNPDQAVALGAAVQAGVLAGGVKDLLLLDIMPLSLGIETMGGVMTPLLPRNTMIPTRRTELFSTASDDQTSVEVHVLQGESTKASDNRSLGKFHLVGLAKAPRGVPQIEVTFDVDANGIVNVSAKDLGTGKEQQITVRGAGGLTDDEIERMVKEAESRAAADDKRRQET